MKRHVALPLLAFAVTAGCAQLPFFGPAPIQGGLAMKGSNACAGSGTGCPFSSVSLASKPAKIGDPLAIEGGATVSEVEIWVRSVMDNGDWRSSGARIATVSASNQVFKYTGALESSYQNGSNTLKIESGQGYQILVGSGSDYLNGGLFTVE